jgi:hypothetical protein
MITIKPPPAIHAASQKIVATAQTTAAITATINAT